MQAAVVVFPGSNRERDVAIALERSMGNAPLMHWHGDAEFNWSAFALQFNPLSVGKNRLRRPCHGLTRFHDHDRALEGPHLRRDRAAARCGGCRDSRGPRDFAQAHPHDQSP